MHSIKIDDLNTFKLFLSLNDVEYVDALFVEDKVSLVSSTEEVFGILPLKVAKSVNSANYNCRIPVHPLKNLAVEGNITLVTDTDDIKMIIVDSNGVEICTAKFKQQSIHLDERKKYMIDLLSSNNNSTDYTTFDLNEIKEILKCAKMLKAPIVANNGVLSAQLTRRAIIYKKLRTPFNFSIFSDSLTLLYKCSNNIFSIENYLGARNGNLVMLATKMRHYSSDDIKIAEEMGAVLKCEIDFINLRSFAYKMKPKGDNLTINIKDSYCKIQHDRIDYSIPIYVTDKTIVPGAVFDEFTIPLELAMGAIFNLPTAKFTIKKKKTFVELKQGDITIMF